MAYGDNRQQVASDTFDSSIGASWDNGPGDFNTYVFVTGGHIAPVSDVAPVGMRRNTGTYNNDQYSTITLQAVGGSYVVGVSVRHPTGATDESCYAGTAVQGGGYTIDEFDSAFGVTNLATGGSSAGFNAAGETMTCEAEGTTVRMGTNEGAGDTQRLSTTDNTLASGRPGMVAYDDNVQITAWAGGDIAVVGGATPHGVFGLAIHGPFGGPFG